MPRLLPLLCLAALPALAQTQLDWQQVGGALGVAATAKGIVGQGYETPVQTGASFQVQGGFLAHRLMVNNAPFVSSPLPDLTEAPGFAAVKIDLSKSFADLDGDALQYTVSTVGNAATASLAQDTLVLAGVNGTSGSVKVIVSASDGSLSVVDTFLVAAQATTGIEPVPRSGLASKVLNAHVPKVFASVVSGVGPGQLGSGRCGEEDECLALDLLLPGAASVRVSIFDQLGTPVIAFDREIGRTELNGLAQSGDGRFLLPLVWNLRAGNGQPVGAGVYLWKIKVRTADGQLLETVHRMGVKGH